MLTFEQKLYQLIISRLDGEKITSSQYQQKTVELVKKGIGGFILFGGKKDEVKGFVTNLQSITEIPLFIASDIERGVGQQIEGATRFPCQMAVAAAINRDRDEDMTILHDAIRAIAIEAVDTGINMPLIPVLDVNRDPDNPIICTRAFSDKPEEVARFGELYIKILEGAGLICCAKHFPGHGDTAVDSHISLPVITKSLKALQDTDLFPFTEAIKAGVCSIMVGHLAIPAIDTLPASLSEKIITGLLREEMGYKGLILTDALNMSALKEIGNVPGKCVQAGVDILLHPADADAAVDDLKRAVSSGELEERKIDTAVDRILRFKDRIDARHAVPQQDANAAELSQLIFHRSVTLVKDTQSLLPLKDMHNVCLVCAGDTKELSVAPFVNAGVRRPGSYGEIADGSTVILAIFTNVAAWKGSSGISKREVSYMQELVKRSRSVVISFGSPYVLRHFTGAGALIAAYDTSEQAQVSVIKCLKGEMGFQGRLPVELKF